MNIILLSFFSHVGHVCLFICLFDLSKKPVEIMKKGELMISARKYEIFK